MMHRQPSSSDFAREESVVPNIRPIISEIRRTLPQRILVHIYEASGIRFVGHLSFWEHFLNLNPDIELRAQDLRRLLFGEVFNEARYLEELPDRIALYLKPMFNTIPTETFESEDLNGSEDFMLNFPQSAVATGIRMNELVNYIIVPNPSVPNIPLVPLNMDAANAQLPSEVTSTGEDDLCKRFARLMHELVRADVGATDLSGLPSKELRERVVALVKMGIAVCDLFDQKMGARKVQQSARVLTEEDQLVPTTSNTTKRVGSFDDSGLGLSPRKRARLLQSSTLPAVRKQELRRTASASTEH
ncbi:uncharacterized protein LOC129763348 [Toxorhynchites rutilus septentrionalis]|uniref:uncharacterized protein LOC129763348 n=1 Tax=Toxorhynchites rutilus septentrionalis TaxID=329112 RepID=UPI002478BD2D|nr:uncharacterized protein LOC129763348 [Toxorhynchites rutilus septentrionalis]